MISQEFNKLKESKLLTLASDGTVVNNNIILLLFVINAKKPSMP